MAKKVGVTLHEASCPTTGDRQRQTTKATYCEKQQSYFTIYISIFGISQYNVYMGNNNIEY